MNKKAITLTETMYIIIGAAVFLLVFLPLIMRLIGVETISFDEGSRMTLGELREAIPALTLSDKSACYSHYYLMPDMAFVGFGKTDSTITDQYGHKIKRPDQCRSYACFAACAVDDFWDWGDNEASEEDCVNRLGVNLNYGKVRNIETPDGKDFVMYSNDQATMTLKFEKKEFKQGDTTMFDIIVSTCANDCPSTACRELIK